MKKMSAHYLRKLDYSALRNCESVAPSSLSYLGSPVKPQREEPAAPRLWLLWGGRGLRSGHREADGPMGGFPSVYETLLPCFLPLIRMAIGF